MLVSAERGFQAAAGWNAGGSLDLPNAFATHGHFCGLKAALRGGLRVNVPVGRAARKFCVRFGFRRQ
jgi:hypothetical protein